jgi:hypothetical protein
MMAVAMVTKVQKMLNSLPTSQSFAVMFHSHHFEFIQPSTAATHYSGYSYKVS